MMQFALSPYHSEGLPEGYEWHIEKREGPGRGNLLLVFGQPRGVVVARVEYDALHSWMLTLDAHREPDRQTCISSASLSEAIGTASLWAASHRTRPLRGV
jgi:hypothetical protein